MKPSITTPPSIAGILPQLGVAAAYAALSWLSVHFFGQASVLFPAAGLSLAALLLGGRRFTVSVFCGALVANLLGGASLWAAIAMAAGAALAARVGAWLVRRDAAFDSRRVNAQAMFRILAWGGFGAALLSAVIGSGTLMLAHPMQGRDALDRVLKWWMGDALGVVLMTPLILAWWPGASRSRAGHRPSNRWLVEAALVFSATVMVGGIVFLEWFHTLAPASLHPLLDVLSKAYWMFLFIAWAALRLGMRGTTIALMLAALMGLSGIRAGTGFFSHDAISVQTTSYWFFTIILSLVGLALSGYIETSRQALRSLRQREIQINRELKNVTAALDQHAIVAITNVQGAITSVNDKFCEISGYTRHELLGQDHRILNSGVHSKGFFQELYRSITHGQVWHGDICNRAKDGRLYWVQTTIVPFMDERGKPTSYVAIRADITARKLASERLRQSEERLQLATRSGGVGIWDWDLAHNLLQWDDVMLGLYGVTRDNFTGAIDAWQAGVHAHDLERCLNDIQEAIHGVRPFDTEFRVVHPDGSIHHLKTSADVVRDEGGRALRLVGVSWDITAAKRMDEELDQYRNHLEELVRQKTTGLQQSESRLSTIFDSTKIHLWAFDGTSYTYINRQWYDFTGQDLNHPLTSELWTSVLHPDDAEQANAIWLAHWESKTEHDNYFRLRRHDGVYRDFFCHAVPITDEHGKFQYFQGFNLDITERRQVEEAAHAANRAKSEFLANMSHEIRTPMNGVVGMVDILQETPLLPEQRRMLATVHDSSLALLGILNDILDFSKIEAGKLEVERIPTHLRDVAEGVVQLMLNVAHAKDAQISLFVDPALPVWILSDPTRLRQILFNLLGNALKFISRGTGRAMLHVHPVTRPDGTACVQFCVIDNGIGMSKQVQARLFQPFTQADESTARKFGGTGLGLSITQRLVQMMDGQIEVRSEPGSGSEFVVEFVLQKASPPTGRLLPAVPDLSGVKVLAVTPDTACSTLLQVYLSAAGADVTLVADTIAARARLSQGLTPALLLLDEPQVQEREDDPGGVWPNELTVLRLVPRGDARSALQDREIASQPLLYQDLLQGVARAVGKLPSGHAGARTTEQGLLRPQAPSVEQALVQGQLILLAEDNETNRDVMQAQLGLLGYTCEVAADGALALQMWRSGLNQRYALLLTDCHMPNMDGFALTEAIRQAEPYGTRLPIIAVTANAMQGEAQRCMERGMDDYLSKPLRLEELSQVLNRWLPLSSPANAVLEPSVSPQVPAAPHAPAVWEAGALGQLVGDNSAMQRRLLEKFLLNATQQVDAIGAAATVVNCAALADVAHTLKSAARTVGAMALGELCLGLETAGRAGDAPGCIDLARDLPSVFAAACQAIQQHLAGS